MPLLFARTARRDDRVHEPRQGGVSGGTFASLNLGFATADDPRAWPRTAGARCRPRGADPRARREPVAAPRRTASREAGAAAPGAYLRGVTAWPDGDALVTAEPGLPAGRARRRLPHGRARRARRRAGWRSRTPAGAGCVAGVLEAAAERVGPGFAAAVGPGAGACCYEVGDDVAGAAARALRRRTSSWTGTPISRLCARRALERAGAAAVATAGLCTICDPERFHSHRRDGAGSGRQAVIAYLEGAPA